MNDKPELTAFYPSVNSGSFSFFENVPEKRVYYLNPKVRNIDADLSLNILNSSVYPIHTSREKLRNTLFRKGVNASFGIRQVSYSHNRNRFKMPNYPIRDERFNQYRQKQKEKIAPILCRINALVHKTKLTIEESLELDNLRFKLSPSYKEKTKKEDELLRKEFKEMLKRQAGNSFNGNRLNPI